MKAIGTRRMIIKVYRTRIIKRKNRKMRIHELRCINGDQKCTVRIVEKYAKRGRVERTNIDLYSNLVTLTY